MRKLTRTIHIASLLVILSGGCIVIPYYAGPDESEPRVLAVRDEPGVAREEIFRIYRQDQWALFMPFSPEGPRDIRDFSDRYYIVSGGKTNSLSHALDQEYHVYDNLLPITGTDRWLRAYTTGRSYDDIASLAVCLFTSRKSIAQHTIENVFRVAPHDDLPGQGVAVFSTDGKSMVFPTTDGDCVLDLMSGSLMRPPGQKPDASQVRHLESPDAGIPYHPHVGVSLYDYTSDRMLWTVPDWWVVSSRTDIDRFITCSGGEDTDHYAEHSVLRLRDGSGAELVRREVAASHLLVAPSPSLKRVSYLIIKKWGKKFAEIEDAQLCVETFVGGMSVSVCRKTFDVAFERQSFRWLTDDVVIGTSFKHRFGKEHGYVVLDVRTGKWHQLPFPAESYSSFVVDESNGVACLGAGNGRFHIYDARIDAVSATFSLSDSGFPRDPGGLRMIGVENGVGVVFAGMRTWMLVGWDGSLVRSGALIRSGIGTIDRYIGHERLAVSMFRTGESAVLSLCNRLMARGARSMPYVDGKFLLGDPNW